MKPMSNSMFAELSGKAASVKQIPDWFELKSCFCCTGVADYCRAPLQSLHLCLFPF